MRAKAIRFWRGNRERKWMREFHLVAISLALVGAWASTASATLIDWGADGEYFYDTESGLYWIDPDEFVGASKADVNIFLTENPNWKWATAAEIDALSGQQSLGGVPLTEVMGPHQFSTGWVIDGIGYTGFRWIGYFDEDSTPPGLPTDPDGWLVQTSRDGPSILDETGFQGGVEGWVHGAWVNASIIPEPTAALLFGAGLLVVGGALRRRQAA